MEAETRNKEIKLMSKSIFPNPSDWAVNSGVLSIEIALIVVYLIDILWGIGQFGKIHSYMDSLLCCSNSGVKKRDRKWAGGIETKWAGLWMTLSH